jgi:hypothetical protein
MSRFRQEPSWRLFCPWSSLGFSPDGWECPAWPRSWQASLSLAAFYASRVMVGHLPLLKVFPSLPLLLWLTDRVVRQPGPFSSASRWKRLLALALASGCLALAGHPQLVIYS